MKWKAGTVAALSLLVLAGFIYRTEASLLDLDPNVEDADVYQAALSAQTQQAAHYQVSSSTPQFIVFSFDGSKSVDMLNQTLDFERAMSAQGKPLHFTYFINAAYFMTKDTAGSYTGPGQKPGVTNIGYSNNAADIAARVATFNTAFAMGNEIGSHTVGHFVGTSWSREDWKQEFDSFNKVLGAVAQNNPSVKIDAPQFLGGITGFRAPDLGANDNLYGVEREFNFAYDSSTVGRPGAWPFKDSNGIWRIPLTTVHVGASGRASIAMDYNFWLSESGGKNAAVKGSPQWNSFLTEVTKAYTDVFDTNYNGTRAPIIIGHHFSQWNDSVYWEAMKAFATEECGKPQVRCVTFSELVSYLNANGIPLRVK